MHKYSKLLGISMQNFTSWLLNEKSGGEAVGRMELVHTHMDVAVEYAKRILGDQYEVIDDFPTNFLMAQSLARNGWTLRKDMPVITGADVHEFKSRLEAGAIDIKAPYARGSSHNPFPQGLTGKQAKFWLEKGLAINDGSDIDDPVKVRFKRVRVSNLRPIQKQIYFDKSMDMLARGFAGLRNYLENKSILIASSDNFIIDGHHRFLGGVLYDPTINVQVLSIDLPIKTLLPMAIAYGDSIGNSRNK